MALAPLQRKKDTDLHPFPEIEEFGSSSSKRKGEFQRPGFRVLALDPDTPFLRSSLLSGRALLISGLPGFVAEFGR